MGLSEVERLKANCFPIDFNKQLCLKLYPSRGIVFELKMKTETKTNLFGPFALLYLMEKGLARGFKHFNILVYLEFRISGLVFPEVCGLRAGCSSVNPAKQPCLKCPPPRSVVYEKYFLKKERHFYPVRDFRYM